MTQVPNASPTPTSADGWLKFFPVTFFAVVMGLMGFTLALRAAGEVWFFAGFVSNVVLVVALTVYASFSAFYLLKLIKHADAVRAEWNHPVKIAFFPTMSISLLLTGTALFADFPMVARVIWLAGVVTQGVLTLSVLTGWISHRSFEQGHLTPAWFIPVVGNVIVPVAGAPMGYNEISWLFFSGGIVFWIVLLTLVFNRMVFHDPIPARLFPTMVVLIAPPAVAFVAYYNLIGGIDPFARILLNLAYVFSILVLIQSPKFLRLPFSLSWWALSFPVAALTAASFLYAKVLQSPSHLIIGFIALAAITVIIVGLACRTVIAVIQGKVFVPD